MLKQLSSFVRLFLFWISFFFLQRLIFILFHYDKLSDFSSIEIGKTFYKGFSLDLSVTGYLLILPSLLLLIASVFPITNQFFTKIIKIYHGIVAILISILSTIDLHIYQEWGNKLNSRAIEFFINSPREAFASSASSPIFISLIFILISIFYAFFLQNRWTRFAYVMKERDWKQVASFPILAFILVIFIRGGFQLAPINQSAVYFSTKPVLNHTAVNTEWNLLHSFIENHFDNTNPYHYMKSEDASLRVKSMYLNDNDSTTDLLKNNKPNIVLIILESFTSDVVEAFGGEKDVAPFLSQLAKDGVCFDHIYASGDRTDKGMIAVLSGFPTQAVRTIIQQPDKFERLPSLPKELIKNGYNTSFYYGGESEFANFKSYLLSTGIEKIIDKKDFDSEQMNSKWGAHDGYLFDKHIKDLKMAKQPFFSVILTLSSHEPFEVPIVSSFKGNDLPSKFKKAANYTDSALKKYFNTIQKESWYNNTLFIIVADHGHRLPKEYTTAYDPGKYRIPLIFYGEALKKEYKGKIVHLIGSQTDIATTLLCQLNISTHPFEWSKNLLNPFGKPFAFYSYDNGFGWINEKQTLTFDNISKQITSAQYSLPDSVNMNYLNNGKAYMQKVFETYLSY